MLIEEIIRSCGHERVAQAAVLCIGRQFYGEIEKAAASYDMTPGGFVALAVERFARGNDDAEIRAVRACMEGAQEPLLAGLHRILCIMLAVGVHTPQQDPHDLMQHRHGGIFDRLDIAARCDCIF